MSMQSNVQINVFEWVKTTFGVVHFGYFTLVRFSKKIETSMQKGRPIAASFTFLFTFPFTFSFTFSFNVAEKENDVFTDAFTDIFTDVSPFAIKIRLEICSKLLSTMRNRFLTLPKAENLYFNDFLTL